MAKTKVQPKKPEKKEEKGKKMDFPIDQIQFHPDLQPRVGDASTPIGGIYRYHVNDIRAAIKRRDEIPRVRIFCVPGKGNFVTDGHHTTVAYQEEGRKTIPAEVFEEKTWLEAVADASRANSQHLALKRTNEDKRRAVGNLLNALEQAGEKWSYNRVAKWCHVTDDLVKNVDLKTNLSESKGDGDESQGKTGADGKVYKNRAGRPPGKRGPKPEPPKPVEQPKPAEPAPVAAAPALTPSAPVVAPAAKEFSLKEYEDKLGAVMREVDACGSQFGVLHNQQAAVLRQLLREFDKSFRDWHQSLTAKKAGAGK